MNFPNDSQFLPGATMPRLSIALLFVSLAQAGLLAAPPVSAVAYSHDGKLLAAGTKGFVYLIDPATGIIAGEYPGQTERVTAVAYSKDGLLAVASGVPGKSGVIRIYDKTAKPSEIAAHADAIYALDFSPDGKTLASAGYDRTVKLWTLGATVKPALTLKDHSDAVYALKFHPEGKLLATGSADRTVKIWDTATGTRLYSLGDSTDWVYTVAWSRDGKQLCAAGVDKNIRVWNANAEGGKLVQSQFAHQSGVLKLLGPTAEGAIHSVGEDRIVKSWSAATLKETLTLPAKPDSILAAALRPDGAQMALGRFDGVLELIDAKSGKVQQTPLPAKPKEPGTKDRFPRQELKGGTDSAKTAAKIARPATVAAALGRPGEIDYFRVEAKAGEQLGFEILTDILDVKKFDPILALLDERGRVVSESFTGHFGYRAPVAGTYAISVSDKEFRGGADFGYRLSVGPIPIITSVFPLGIPRGTECTVRVRGVNLGVPDGIDVKITAPATAELGSRIPVPKIGEVAPLGAASVVVGEFASTTDTALTVPGTFDGVLAQAGDSQTIIFDAKKGETLAVEVHAARLGSKLDSVIEIRDDAGEPVEQTTLRSVLQTYTTFRDHDSNNPGIRLDTWNELRTDDYLFVGSELMRIKALPKNPDDDCQFVQLDGKRLGFRGTTPTHHAQNAPMYKVEFHPPGSKFPPNGLPTFALHYRNDDGGPGFGKDSFLLFDAPKTGRFRVTLRDARGAGGEEFGYRLTVRAPKPSYTLRLSPSDPKVWKNSGIPLTVTASRTDGFSGPIRIRFDKLAAGFAAPETIIEAEQPSATVALSATGIAGAGAPFRVIGEATIDGKPVLHEVAGGTPSLVEPGELSTLTSVTALSVAPGREAKMRVTIARAKGFAGRVPVEVRGLPHGVRVENIGLSGILILPEESEREVAIFVESWVKPMEVPFVVLSKNEKTGGEFAAKSVLLKIEK